MIIEAVLKGHDLFSILSIEDIDFISSISGLKNFNSGETIFRDNAAASHVYLLLEGQVFLRIPTRPGEAILASKVGKGELFGLSPMLGSDRYSAAAYCRSPSTVLAIEAKPFRDMLIRDCRAGFEVMNHVAHVYFTRYTNMLKNLQSVVDQIPLIHL